MKILIVSKCPTHPTTAGNRYWILSQAELFMQMGHEVHFLYVDEPAFQQKNVQEHVRESMSAYWKERLHWYTIPLWEKCYKVALDKIRKYVCRYTWKCDDGYPHNLHRVINCIDKKHHFDACIVNYFYLTKAFKRIHIPLKALSTHDCFTFKSLVTGKKSVNSLTPNSEAKAMQRSPHIFALQEEEACFFKKLSPRSKVYTVYGIYEYKSTACAYNKNMLFFSGGNEYNINGLTWFVSNAFPLIIRKFPDVCLIIGGGICKAVAHYANHPHIKLFGYVDNPEDFFRLGDVAINPTYQGTGLKIKTFESIAYGKVVMVHPHSVEGIFQKNNAPLFVSDVPSDWLSFLEKLWNTENSKMLIDEYQKRDEAYILALKKHVTGQYRDFLLQMDASRT